MEAQNSEHGHDLAVSADKPPKERTPGGSRACEGVTCGFSDAKASSRDAKERLASMKKLLIAVTLCIGFMAVEVVGGIKANSLAILTDAAHLLSDVAAFAISLFSLWASGWEATPRQSYGFYRIEILGALISIQLVWLLAGILVYEAIVRLIHSTGKVHGSLMFLVSAFGLLVNVIMALMLGHDHNHGHGQGCNHGHANQEQSSEDHHRRNHVVIVAGLDNLDQSCPENDEDDSTRSVNPGKPLLNEASVGKAKSESGHKHNTKNINVQGAYLHVLGDSIQSIGVMIGGAIIWYKPEWKIIDLICTLIFSAVVLGTTVKMLQDILEVLMESTPREIDAMKLEKGVCEMDEVVAVHELHIWAITVGKVLLACHVKIRQEADADMVLDKVIDYIRREYNISHVTIQIERE